MMINKFAAAVFLFQAPLAFADAGSSVVTVNSASWVGPTPSEYSMALVGPDFSFSGCKAFKDLMVRVANDPKVAARSFERRRMEDPDSAPQKFSRSFSIPLPGEGNLLADGDSSKLAKLKPANAVPGSWLVPSLVEPVLESASITTSGYFEKLRLKLQVAPPSFSLSEDPRGTIVLTTTSADLFCDLVDPSANPHLKLNAVASASDEGEKAYRTFHDPLVKQLDPVFERDEKDTRRAALLGFRTAAYLDGKMPSASLEQKEAVGENLLDKFVNFTDVSRSSHWSKSLDGTMRSEFVSQSNPFSVFLNLKVQ